MADRIFTKETVTRANLASWLYQKMTDAGWLQISSKISSDGYVFQSDGEAGNANLFINLNLDSYSNGSSAFSFSWWMLLGYTPGAPGVAGTFNTRLAMTYQPTVSYINHPLDTAFDVHYSINKDRVILSFSIPIGLATYVLYNKYCCSNFFYVGLPDPKFRFQTGNPSCPGMVYMLSPGYSSYFIPAAYWWNPPYTNNPSWDGGYRQGYLVNSFNYKQKGIVPMVPLIISNTQGMPMVLEDIRILPTYSALELIDGDIIDVGGLKYRVCISIDSYSPNLPIYYGIRVV